MGKRSRRNRKSKGENSINNDDIPRSPPNLRTDDDDEEEETKDNLRFEDPFEDQYEKEELVNRNNNNGQEEEEEALEKERVMTLNPYHATKEPLEMDPAAYKMHFSLGGEWPSLSFGFVKDPWGEGRTRFPHQLLAVVGTQADRPENNSIQLWKLSDLGKLEQANNKDYDEWEAAEDDDNDDNEEEEEEEEEMDYDPVLEHAAVAHDGGVNRLRVQKGLVSSWSDSGHVHLYRLDGIEGGDDHVQAPQLVHSYRGHATEGYALDFSLQDRLATGDNQGSIHVWTDPSRITVTPMYQSKDQKSVEDIQWSPTETTVLAAGEEGGLVKIYDIRAPNRHMLEKTANPTDVNVLSWSKLVTNLLATGCDDGEWSVWDLRKFQDPLARFTPHTTPITSMEWHPTDESMIVVSDEVGSFVYDLSVEEEEETTHDDDEERQDLPPQLLFVHSGSPQTKEVHWHPQITSCLMSTAYDGFHIFMPSNL